MKIIRFGIALVLLSSAGSTTFAQEAVFNFTNRLAIPRNNELVALDRAVVEKRFGTAIKPYEVKVAEGEGISDLQFDDLDGNGEWDKLVFLISLKPNEVRKIKLVSLPAGDVIIRPLAHVRQKRKKADQSFGPSLMADSIPAGQPNTDFNKAVLPPFLTEGPAWENDKVGFRIYLDVRNTKDIWGKTTSGMMMDLVGVDPKLSYHHPAPWGMDILAVGKSLGAGSLAMRVPRKGQTDTLVRLGGLNMGKVKYKLIADGPARAVFQLEYPEWNVLGDGNLVSLTEQISIWGGQYFYESKVTLKNAPAGTQLVTGIVNLKSTKVQEYSDKKVSLLSTYDVQSENKDNLGMAVFLGTEQLVSFGKTPNQDSEVLNTYTVNIKVPQAKQQASFRFYACWSKSDPQFNTAEGFSKYLSTAREFYTSPVVIK